MKKYFTVCQMIMKSEAGEARTRKCNKIEDFDFCVLFCLGKVCALFKIFINAFWHLIYIDINIFRNRKNEEKFNKLLKTLKKILKMS